MAKVKFRHLEGAYCAKAGAPNGLWGVSGSTVLNQDGSGTCPQTTWYTTCPYFKTGTVGKGVGKLDIAVTLRDPGQDDVMRVVYRWRFRSEGVKMWAYVEPRGRTIANWEDPLHPGTFTTGVPFAKEPKFVVGLRGSSTPSGPLFTRVVEFTGTTVKGFSFAAARGSALEATNVGTDSFNADNRNRVRWDFPSWTTSSPGFGQPPPNSARLRQREPCPLKTAPPTTPACFTVVMRAYNPDSIRSGSLGQPSINWESGNAAGSGVGLDQWAFDARVQQPAYPKDTKTTPTQNPECIIFPYSQPPTDPALPDLRRWEVAGRKDVSGLVGLNQQKDNPRIFGVSASMFHAWVGGRGPSDCEPLLRALPTEGRAQAAPSCTFRVGGICRYGVFASFGLNNGYPPQLRGQAEDYAEETALPSPY